MLNKIELRYFIKISITTSIYHGKKAWPLQSQHFNGEDANNHIICLVLSWYSVENSRSKPLVNSTHYFCESRHRTLLSPKEMGKERNKTQSLFLKQKEILGMGIDYTRGRF